MESYLDKIIEAKAEVVVAQKSSLNIQDIKNQLDEVQPTRGFVNAIKKRNKSDLISVIAEIKKASPSKGVICENFEPSLIAKQYQDNGATCLSILTDEEFFQGSLTYLKEISSEVDIPLLRKDFIIDEYQIYQSRYYGADCILLIVAALSDSQLKEYKENAD